MRVRRAIALFVSLFLVGTIAGCPGRASVSSKGDPSGKPSSEGISAEDLLKSAIHQLRPENSLRPENFSIEDASDKPVSLLNSWRGMMADTKSAEANDRGAVPPLLTGWATADEEKRLRSDKYDEQDAAHIRDCLLTQAMAKYLADTHRYQIGPCPTNQFQNHDPWCRRLHKQQLTEVTQGSSVSHLD